MQGSGNVSTGTTKSPLQWVQLRLVHRRGVRVDELMVDGKIAGSMQSCQAAAGHDCRPPFEGMFHR